MALHSALLTTNNSEREKLLQLQESCHCVAMQKNTPSKVKVWVAAFERGLTEFHESLMGIVNIFDFSARFLKTHPQKIDKLITKSVNKDELSKRLHTFKEDANKLGSLAETALPKFTRMFTEINETRIALKTWIIKQDEYPIRATLMNVLVRRRPKNLLQIVRKIADCSETLLDYIGAAREFLINLVTEAKELERVDDLLPRGERPLTEFRVSPYRARWVDLLQSFQQGVGAINEWKAHMAPRDMKPSQ